MKFGLVSIVAAAAPMFASPFTVAPSLASHSRSALQGSSSDEVTNDKGNVILDVSDLGLTMADLQKPFPKEDFSVESSGYQSTSRVSGVEDKGCYWVENPEDMDVTLRIPGLIGQPAACISVLFSTTTVSVTAFGRVVWSCIQMGISDVDDCNFLTEDGEDRIPIIQMNLKKRDIDEGSKWGGFVLQVGEDSIL
uniref:Uncharacterized protein n=1 Tax=Chaetoceros debilis TaxID=122233 RepID=A0A7S3QDY3_9STRA|eukprot:CAMPEP_0194086766 /NCGR_PEP_ID=MMETSP0149-20130528/22379_1 /TAXON_ID=122233 /ORGANISM="Chaetoceros debilis, Strain MM31A-1" /LENGTH=193 /DNA_ID=CAMNT_0038769939 /DNA_START=65 /DNA_END=646 /DNA_ORIENTATION=+